MHWLRFTLVLLLVSLLQACGLLDTIALTTLHIKPDFLLILLVFFAINCDTYDAVIASFAIGFAADITGAVMGPFFLAFGIMGSALAHVRQVVMLKRTLYQAIIISVVGFLVGGIAKFLVSFKIESALQYGFWRLAGTAFYSALFWFIAKWVVQAIGNWTGIGRKRLAIR